MSRWASHDEVAVCSPAKETVAASWITSDDKGGQIAFWTSRDAVCINPTTTLATAFSPIILSALCTLNQPNHSFQAYAVSIEEMKSRSERRCYGLLEDRKSTRLNSSHH